MKCSFCDRTRKIYSVEDVKDMIYLNDVLGCLYVVVELCEDCIKEINRDLIEINEDKKIMINKEKWSIK